MTTYDPDDLLLGSTGTRCYFSPREAQQAAASIAALHGVPCPALSFESPIPFDAHAVTLQRQTEQICVVGFCDRGVSLEMLAHELAHVVYYGHGETEHTHDDAFALLMCLIGWQLIGWLSDTQWDWYGNSQSMSYEDFARASSRK